MLGISIKGTIYRSRDHGFKWVKLKKRLLLSITQKLKKFKGVTNVFQSKNDSNAFILLGDSTISFTTEDCGSSFKSFPHAQGVVKVQMHPSKQGTFLMLVSKVRKCLTPLCLPNKSLFLVQKSGKEVTRVQKNVLDFAWAFQSETAEEGFPEDRIIIQRQVEGGEVEGKKWSEKYSIFYSDDLFRTKPKTLLHRGNKFALSTHFIFVAKVLSEKR